MNNTISNTDPIKLSTHDFQSLSNPDKSNDSREKEEYNIDLSDDDEDDEEINISDDEDDDEDEVPIHKFSNSQFNNNSFKLPTNNDNINDNINDNMNDNMNDDDESDGSDGSNESGDQEISSDEDQEDQEEEEAQPERRASEFPDLPPANYGDRARFKQEMLIKLARLEKQGYIPSKRFTLASSYDDILFEYRRLKRQRSVEKSIKFSRNALLTIVTGIEFLNTKFDPLNIKLKGWSQEQMSNMSDYDEIFEELHDKYGESIIGMPPEIKLLMMVAGSAFMFHLSNSLFSSATPDLQDILRQNPDIMDNITQAAVKKMQESGDLNINDPVDNMMMSGVKMKKKKELDDVLNNLKGNLSGPVQKSNMKVFDKKNVNGISLNL